MSETGEGGEVEPGSCGFFAYVNPPRSPVLLEDTALLLWSVSGPGHGQLMHNSAEFWMIILYGTVYFFWPFISSCAMRSLCLPLPVSLSLPFTISFSSSSFLFFSLFLYSFQLLALEMIPSRRWRKNHHQMVQPCPGASRGGTCHVLLPCALSIEPKTSDIRPTTHDCPAPLQATTTSPFLITLDRNQSASLCGKWQRIIWFYFMCSKWPTEKNRKKK